MIFAIFRFWIVEVDNIAFRIAEIGKLTSLLVEYLLHDLWKIGFVEVIWCFPDFQFLTFHLLDIDNIAFDL